MRSARLPTAHGGPGKAAEEARRAGRGKREMAEEEESTRSGGRRRSAAIPPPQAAAVAALEEAAIIRIDAKLVDYKGEEALRDPRFVVFSAQH